MNKIVASVSMFALAACTTANTRNFSTDIARPAPGTKVLLVEPDIDLGLLTAVGAREPRGDWSEQGEANVGAALEAALKEMGHTGETFDPDEAMSGRIGQVLRLHEAVGSSILFFNYSPIKLPSKEGAFDWTLGVGVQELQAATGADYALFTFGGGAYSSSGRAAVMVLSAVAGVGLPPASQQVFSSLVDLRTGQVLWSNYVVAAPNSDMRSPEGAEVLVRSLLKDAPL